MARMVKCYGDKCTQDGIKWEKDKLFNKGGKNYCRDCYTTLIKDEDDRKTLYTVISQVFGIPFPNGQMLRQIKEFRRIRTYEYEDIAKAILYSKHILEKEMSVKYGLGLIPYVIEDAKQYYKDQSDRANSMKDKKIFSENKVVKKQFSSYDKDEKRNKKIINMEDIL